jgi:predicted NBD/HSP70 family sugar kinase
MSRAIDMREHNRRAIVGALRRYGSLSRADLARLTGLSAQGVGNVAEGLLADRLVREIGRKHGGRGQPPIHLAIDPQGASTVGIEIRHDSLVCVAADLSGALVDRRAQKIARADPESVARALPRLVGALRARSPILGIGIVGPGPLGSETGAAGLDRPTELPGWRGLADPRAFLSGSIERDVSIETDASAAALAEYLYGAGRGRDRIACLYFGRGLGMGLVLDGRLYRGATGNAGEIGHVAVEPGGRACFCGQLGCLERYVSLDAALADLRAARIEKAAGLARWLDMAADRLKRAIIMIENILDVDTVVLTGLSETLVRGLSARLGDLPPALVARPGARIVEGTCGEFSAAWGAAALPLYDREAPHLAVGAER